jgi:hypothetical protein
MIMTDPSDKLDPMSLLFYMSSFSVMLLLPSTLILEPGVFGEVRRVPPVSNGCLQPSLPCVDDPTPDWAAAHAVGITIAQYGRGHNPHWERAACQHMLMQAGWCRRLQVLTVLHAKPAFFWTLLVNSCMAYAVNLTNFMVTKYTSALTLQVGHQG